jgi:hypothetical protein
MMMETWKEIPKFGGHYEASTLGRIRSKDRVVTKFSFIVGKVVNQKYKGRLLSPSKTNKYGYLSVHLGVDGVRYTIQVSHLVLLAYTGEKPEGCEACHNNGIANDNRPENLRWDTHLNNNRDRFIHGTYALGEAHPMAKITANDAIAIYQSKEKGIDLAKKYGLAPSKISAIRLGQTWKSVTQGISRD